jgi:hypothetical protein
MRTIIAEMSQHAKSQMSLLSEEDRSGIVNLQLDPTSKIKCANVDLLVSCNGDEVDKQLDDYESPSEYVGSIRQGPVAVKLNMD